MDRMNNRTTRDYLSAGELRELGCEISTDIPDCATVPRSAVEFSGPRNAQMEGTRFSCDVGVVITEAFRWIEIDVEISDAEDLR